MKRNTRLFAGVSAVALAVGTMAVIAPAAHANPNQLCSGSVTIAHSNLGLTDQTQEGVKVTGNLGRNYSPSNAPNFPRIGGTCTNGYVRPGDPRVPQPPATLHPLAQAVSLLGNVSCVSNDPNPQSKDTNSAVGYRLNGKITWTFSETYIDMISATAHKYRMQAYVQIAPTPGDAPDEVRVAGIVISGVAVGSMVSGTVWENPVVSVSPLLGHLNTKYDLDATAAADCADKITPYSAPPVSYVMIGGGDPTTPSALGTVAQGLTFTYPLPY